MRPGQVGLVDHRIDREVGVPRHHVTDPFAVLRDATVATGRPVEDDLLRISVVAKGSARRIDRRDAHLDRRGIHRCGSGIQWSEREGAVDHHPGELLGGVEESGGTDGRLLILTTAPDCDVDVAVAVVAPAGSDVFVQVRQGSGVAGTHQQSVGSKASGCEDEAVGRQGPPGEDVAVRADVIDVEDEPPCRFDVDVVDLMARMNCRFAGGLGAGR